MRVGALAAVFLRPASFAGAFFEAFLAEAAFFERAGFLAAAFLRPVAFLEAFLAGFFLAPAAFFLVAVFFLVALRAGDMVRLRRGARVLSSRNWRPCSTSERQGEACAATSGGLGGFSPA